MDTPNGKSLRHCVEAEWEWIWFSSVAFWTNIMLCVKGFQGGLVVGISEWYMPPYLMHHFYHTIISRYHKNCCLSCGLDLENGDHSEPECTSTIAHDMCVVSPFSSPNLTFFSSWCKQWWLVESRVRIESDHIS